MNGFKMKVSLRGLVFQNNGQMVQISAWHSFRKTASSKQNSVVLMRFDVYHHISRKELRHR